MKLQMIVLVALSLSSISQASHLVKQVLPDGKFLICLDGNEKRVGDKIEVYDRKQLSKSSFTDLKISEKDVMKPGETIRLTHDEYHSRNNRHVEELGQAKVVAYDFSSATMKFPKNGPRDSFAGEEVRSLTSSEAQEFQNTCIVAEAMAAVKKVEIRDRAFRL